jgi:rhodanese-related sulfurtransferase
MMRNSERHRLAQRDFERGIFLTNHRTLLEKVLAVLVIFLLAGTSVSSRMFAAPQQPLSWADVFALIKRDWPEVPQMTTQELAQRMADGGDAVPLLIDVRTRREYEVSHLPGAVWAESSGQIERVLDGVSEHQVIVLYCSAGVRSSRAAAKLIESGHLNVFNLEGSIFQWANERRPVLKDGKVAEVVHPYDERWGVLLDARFHPPAQR